MARLAGAHPWIRRRVSTGAILASITATLVGCKDPPGAPGSMSPADLREARCLGPATASAFVVYLHGVDSTSPSEQEMDNRRTLARLADEMSLRIALPRAKATCPEQPGSICWGWSFQDAELAGAAQAVDDAARACFGERPFRLVGFSNGGYLLTKALRSCSLRARFPRAEQVVTVGSAMLRGPLEPTPARLEDCGSLVMLIGTGDTHNFDPSENYLRALQAKGARVRAERFDGGHVLPHDALRAVLQAPRP